VPHVTAESGGQGALLSRSAAGSIGAPSTATLTFEVTVSRIRFVAPYALAALVLLTACDTRVVTEPEYQPQVVNVRNDFAYQVTGLEEFTSDVLYQWESDGRAASVLQAPSVLTGTALLFIADGAGVQVYQRSLGENGTFTTTAGTPGTWTVRLKFSEASGSATFHLTKP
jgi:hypothetical protein